MSLYSLVAEYWLICKHVRYMVFFFDIQDYSKTLRLESFDFILKGCVYNIWLRGIEKYTEHRFVEEVTF